MCYCSIERDIQNGSHENIYRRSQGSSSVQQINSELDCKPTYFILDAQSQLFSFGSSSMLLHLNVLVPGFWRLGVQISFFRQFGVAVGKSDYLTLRIGFISVRILFGLLGSLVLYVCMHSFGTL